MESGTRLGPYEILEQIGAGGMGEVWLAQDSRLGRKVAIKVLPEVFAGEPDRLARFKQEARAAAALNHPHIAVVHDVGHEDGVHFMVQEYLNGETLRATIARGRMPLPQALKLAGEICEALAAAHAAGIVHRDLKPENVFVAEDGHAKVLDFGLAKLTEMATAGGSGSASMSPTMLGTATGQIMGTAGYMAPEQVQGGEVDHRADLFAFGCVLYELASGKGAFRGKNIIETLNRVTNVDPDGLETVDGTLPAELQRILDKALAKDPRLRYQSASDLAVDLQVLGRQVESGKAMGIAVESVEAANGSVAPKVVAAAFGGLMVGALTLWALQPVEEPEPLTHFAFDAVDDVFLDQMTVRAIDISPDGRRIAISDAGAIWMRDLSDPKLVMVEGTEGGQAPLFSPDGDWLAFWARDHLHKVPVSGGAPIELAQVTAPFGSNWEPDGTILVGQGPGGILRVPDAGGVPEPLIELGEGEWAQGPSMLPGGEWLLFTLRAAGSTWDDGTIVAQSLVTDERRTLVSGGTEPRYLDPGYLLYAQQGNLRALRFDAGAVTVGEGPVPVASGIQMAVLGISGNAFYDVSTAGDFVYFRGSDSEGDLSLAFYDMTGNIEILDFLPARYERPAISPDGSRLAVDIRTDSGGSEIWLYDIERGTTQPLTSDGLDNSWPVWSPDGDWIYYAHASRGSGLDLEIYRRRSDSTGEAERVGVGGSPSAVSPEGDRLAIFLASWDVGILEVESGEVERVTTASLDATWGFSPDGQFLAYSSEEGGTWRQWVRELDTGARTVVSSGSGSYGTWSPEGDAFYYVDIDALTMMRVPLDLADDLELGTPTPMFSTRAIAEFPYGFVRITPDGERFLFLTPYVEENSEPVRGEAPGKIHVWLNAVHELERRFSQR